MLGGMGREDVAAAQLAGLQVSGQVGKLLRCSLCTPTGTRHRRACWACTAVQERTNAGLMH